MEIIRCKRCDMIMDYSPYFKHFYCVVCDNVQHLIKTNFEVIKDMTEEELAEFLHRVAHDDCNTCCDNLSKCLRNNAIEPICSNHYITWLKSEAAE